MKNSIVKWRPKVPWRPGGRAWDWDFEDFFEDFEEDLLEPTWIDRDRQLPRWAPRVETYHKEGNYIVKADLPGIDPKDVQVTVEGDRLIIQGERKTDKEVKRKDFRKKEVFYGSFRRALPIPKGLKADKIKAKYHNGVLEISAPMDKDQLPKQIKVEAD
ncbi:MAG: Hsp20/alpha crystallin family protein [Syntrophaceae bacterium]|nr:Hsp20/alpha crystallin family protein [Syntrophaceae bacterium]